MQFLGEGKKTEKKYVSGEGEREGREGEKGEKQREEIRFAACGRRDGGVERRRSSPSARTESSPSL